MSLNKLVLLRVGHGQYDKTSDPTVIDLSQISPEFQSTCMKKQPVKKDTDIFHMIALVALSQFCPSTNHHQTNDMCNLFFTAWGG